MRAFSSIGPVSVGVVIVITESGPNLPCNTAHALSAVIDVMVCVSRAPGRTWQMEMGAGAERPASPVTVRSLGCWSEGAVMGQFLERLRYFQRPREPFSDGWGAKRIEARQWEDSYRNQWAHDKLLRPIRGVNCTGSCTSGYSQVRSR